MHNKKTNKKRKTRRKESRMKKKTQRKEESRAKKKTTAVFVKRDNSGRQRCSPYPKGNNFSCFSNEDLNKLRDNWNIANKSSAIVETDPKQIWLSLKTKMASVCNKESCWTKQEFMAGKEGTTMLRESFAPESPEDWERNPNEWLSSVDIINVMKQYEKAFKCFEFLGPSPIDFNSKESDGDCVWEELCKFSLEEQLRKGKTKIGIIFNLDDHDEPGSHWVSLFIDIKKSQIVFFDSAGEKIPAKIKNFSDKVVEQGKKLARPIKFAFDQNHPVEHQYGNTECGVYSIYFIVHMLKDRTNAHYLKTHILPDKFMENFRHIYFNQKL
jgi:hypothetical protein